MATNKKIATKKPVKKVAAKKTVKPVAKKAAPLKKAAKATKKIAPVKKAAANKAVARPVKKAAKKAPAPAKKAQPAKKVQPVKKAVAKKAVKPEKKVAAKPASPVKKAVSKTVTPVKKAQPAKTIAHKPVVKKEEKKLSKHIKEEIVAIRKPEKKKEQPLKEVKIPKTSVKTSKPYAPDYKPLEDRLGQSENNAPMIRYSDAELEEFRELINKKLADASREVAYLQGIITRKDDMGGDVEARYMTMEDGTISMEREQMSQMVSRQISFIDNLKKALMRIENKTYGICRVTGKLIDKARLRAVPHATLSLEAKMGLARSKEQSQ